jgi:hypothetical protein
MIFVLANMSHYLAISFVSFHMDPVLHNDDDVAAFLVLILAVSYNSTVVAVNDSYMFVVLDVPNADVFALILRFLPANDINLGIESRQ